MVSAAPVAYPATPTKGDPVEEVIRRLNADYDLGVQLPDRSLTPARRKQLGAQDEQFARHDRICTGIRFLYHQRDGSLDRAIESFFNEAKAASQRWVPKPRADPTTLPSSSVPPKAQTAGQRWNLQTILITVLDNFRAQKMPPLVLPTARPAPRAGPVAPAAPALPPILSASDDSEASPVLESPGSGGSKRSFELHGDDDHGAKRLRGRRLFPASSAPGDVDLTSAIDSVPARQRLGPAPFPGRESLPTRHRHGPEGGSFSSQASSSRYSSLFSSRSAPYSTQSTLEASSQEKRRAPPTVAPPSSSSSFSGASNPRAAHVASPSAAAWTSAPHAPSKHPAPDPPSHPHSPSDASSDFSGFSVFSDACVAHVLEQPVPEQRVALRNAPTNGGLSPVQRRLQSIWREFQGTPAPACALC